MDDYDEETLLDFLVIINSYSPVISQRLGPLIFWEIVFSPKTSSSSPTPKDSDRLIKVKSPLGIEPFKSPWSPEADTPEILASLLWDKLLEWR